MDETKKIAGRPKGRDVRKPAVVLLLDKERAALQRAAKRSGLSFSRWASLELMKAAANQP